MRNANWERSQAAYLAELEENHRKQEEWRKANDPSYMNYEDTLK